MNSERCPIVLFANAVKQAFRIRRHAATGHGAVQRGHQSLLILDFRQSPTRDSFTIAGSKLARDEAVVAAGLSLNLSYRLGCKATCGRKTKTFGQSWTATVGVGFYQPGNKVSKSSSPSCRIFAELIWSFSCAS